MKGNNMKGKNMKKRITTIFTCLTLLTALMSGCGSQATNDAKEGSAELSHQENIEINVFAAASMQETLTQLADDYMSEHEGVKIQLNLDSSGTLKTQIMEGADCDIFISAAQKQMDELAEEEYVDEETRVNLLENKVALVVPEGNPKDIHSFSEIAEKAEVVAIGNEDVPVGQYSIEILTNLDILDQLEKDGKITYGSNVKEVTTQVLEGVADCGIVYSTDAFSAGLTCVDEAGEDLCQPAIYPAAMMRESKNETEAKEFLQYLEETHAGDIFESVGFQFLPK